MGQKTEKTFLLCNQKFLPEESGRIREGLQESKEPTQVDLPEAQQLPN